MKAQGACCEGNLAASTRATYVLLPSIPSGNDILRSTDSGQTWTKVYPPGPPEADLNQWGIEGDLRAYKDDIIYFGTLLGSGIVARSSNLGASWSVLTVPVASAVNDQAWLYMGPLKVSPLQSAPYVLAGWFRVGEVAAFSLDGGLSWPIQTPLIGDFGSSIAPVCQLTAKPPGAASDSRVPNAEFARMKAGRHGGFGTDGRFYWALVSGNELFVCRTRDFGANWEGFRHPVAAGTPANAPPGTLVAFDQKGTLYILHGPKLYVSFNQGQSFAHIHTLPVWGNSTFVGDGAAAWFVVSGGDIHLALHVTQGVVGCADSGGCVVYEKGSGVDTGLPKWRQELVGPQSGARLDFMQIALDGNNIPTIGYTRPGMGVVTSSRIGAAVK